MRQSNELDMNSSTFLNMAQQIQEAIVRIRLQQSSTPLDIAAQVAPILPPLKVFTQICMYPKNKIMSIYNTI